MSSPDSISFPRTARSGLENLADELADAWDNDETDFDEGVSDLCFEDTHNLQAELPLSPFKVDVRRIRDSGIDVNCSTDTTPSKSYTPSDMSSRKASLTFIPESPSQVLKERSRNSVCPGRDERKDTWRSLDTHMKDLDRLIQLGYSHRLLETTNFEWLRELGDQAAIESMTNRLISASLKTANHLIDETKVLLPFTYAKIAPILQALDDHEYEELQSLIVSTIATMPKPTSATLSSLAQLHKASRNILESLSCISDSIHMSRQTTEAAARRLRTVIELASDLSRDASIFEDSERWIEKGDWQARLAKRESAAVCDQVLSGFDEVCNSWRAKLVSGAA